MKKFSNKVTLSLVIFLVVSVLAGLVIKTLRENALRASQREGMAMTGNFASEEHGGFEELQTLLSFGTACIDRDFNQKFLTVESTVNLFMERVREVLGTERISAYLIREDGSIMSPEGETRAPAVLDAERRRWYEQTLDSPGGETVYTNVYTDVNSGKPVVTMAQRSHLTDNVLAFDIYPENYRFYFDPHTLHEGDSFFFCDGAGRIIFSHTNLELDADSLNAYVGGILKKIENHELDNYDAYIRDFDGMKRVVYFTRLDNGWYSILTVPYGNIGGAVDILFTLLFLAVLLFFSAIVIYSWHAQRALRLIDRTNETVRVLGNSYYALYRVDYGKNTYEMIKGSEYMRKRLPPKGCYGELLEVALGRIHQDSRKNFRLAFSLANIRSLVEDKVRNFGGEFQRLFGTEYRWVSVRMLYDETLAPEEVVLCFQDIQDLKKRQMQEEELLRQSLELSRQSERSKQGFFSNVSHEMRTPLNAIIGMSEIALGTMEHCDRADLRRYLERISYSSKQLKQLIDDVLEVSRLEQGSFSLNNEPFNLYRCLSDAVEPYVIEAGSEYKKFFFQMEPEEELVLGDSLRVTQVLNNLLSNAFKFTYAGDTIVVEAARLPAEGVAKYRIIVRDTGIGISKEFLPKLFTPYARDGSFAARHSSGTGLGMTITKTLVEQMNGEISVESELGKGTTFAIVVPFAPAPVERHEKKDADGAGAGAAAGGAAAPAAREEPVDLAELEGLEVLVAEDNQLNMELLTEVLAMSKVAATRAWNGKEAVDLFARSEHGHFDLILMDMQMPEMNGCEAARAIRSLKRPDSDIPIVAVTANAFAEDMLASMQAGMNAHISKPIDFKALQTLMVRLKRGRKVSDKP